MMLLKALLEQCSHPVEQRAQSPARRSPARCPPRGAGSSGPDSHKNPEVIKATVLEDSPRCGVPSAHKAFMERRAETSYRHESKSVTGGGAVERNRAEHGGHLIIFSYSRSGFGRCVQPGLVRGGRPATVCRSNAPARPRHRPRAETQHSTTSPAAVGSNSWAGKDEVIRAIMLGDSPCLLHGLWEM